MQTQLPTRFWSDCDTPIGRLTLTANARGLDGLHFPGRAPERHEAEHRPERFEQAMAQLREYFAGHRTHFELGLDLSPGTAFQRSVWTQLQALPYGQTISYGQLAARLGRIDRVRAVGAAVGRTPIPIIVPCHRVIGSDGSLTGYRGGLPVKRDLLNLELAVSNRHPAPPRNGPRHQAFL